jgi:hypothetical protein
VGSIVRLDGDVERVLARDETADEPPSWLGDFVDEVRYAYLRSPDDVVAERHVAAVVAAARSVTAPVEPVHEPASAGAADAVHAPARRLVRRRVMQRRRGALRLALAVGVLTVSAAGALAASGVADIPVLPDRAADRAKEAVVRAPVRGERRSEAAPPAFVGTLLEAIEAVPPGERGCEFGRRVATIASGRDPTEGNACSRATRRNGAEGPSRRENRGNGADTGAAASGGVSAQAQAGAVAGSPSVGDQASGGVASQAGAGQLSGGPSVGDQASGGVASQAGAGQLSGGPSVGNQASGVAGQATAQAPAGGAAGGAGAQAPASGGAAGAAVPAPQAGSGTGQQVAETASGQGRGPGGRP